MMKDKVEQIIDTVYKIWRQKLHPLKKGCPDEETLICFMEGRLTEEENQQLKKHFIGCDNCLELVSLVSQEAERIALPEDLIMRAKEVILQRQSLEPALLEIILALKEKTIDLIKTSGNILFGQEFAPLPVLRGRNIKDFGEEVTIVKDLANLKTEIELENKSHNYVKITLKLADISTGKPVEGLRISLIREGEEIESYIVESGKIIFDNVLADNYSIEISTPELTLGKILLEIKRIPQE